MLPQDAMRMGLQLIAAWMVGRGLIVALNSILPTIWPIVAAWAVGWIPHFVVGLPLFLLARPIARMSVRATELGRVQIIEIGLRLLGWCWCIDAMQGVVHAILAKVTGYADSTPLLVRILANVNSIIVGVAFIVLAGSAARRLSRWV